MAKRSIGVDVGSTGVRAAEVQYDGKKAKILRAAEVPLPRGAVIGGEVREPEEVSLAVKQLWKDGRFSSKVVSVGLGGPQTMVRQVDLPWEPAEIFRESLPLRVSNDLPVDPMEMTLDYHPLDERMVGKSRIQRSLVVASVNIAAENLADALALSGLKLKRADFTPFALIRAAVVTAGNGEPVPGAQPDGEDWDCEVVVDVGAQNTTVAIHRFGRPLFIRVVSAGSEAVSRALADNLGMSIDAAEELHRTLGISSVTQADAPNELLSSLNPTQINGAKYIANAMAGSLVQVVRESVEYFLAASPSISGVSRILLSGGGSLMPGYADRVASELRAPTSLLAPMHGWAVGQAAGMVDLDPRMAASVGLALEVR